MTKNLQNLNQSTEDVLDNRNPIFSLLLDKDQYISLSLSLSSISKFHLYNGLSVENRNTTQIHLF